MIPKTIPLSIRLSSLCWKKLPWFIGLPAILILFGPLGIIDMLYWMFFVIQHWGEPENTIEPSKSRQY